MKKQEILETTANSNVWARVHKMVLTDNRLINCAYCSYHRGENEKSQRNWKKNRKAKYRK